MALGAGRWLRCRRPSNDDRRRDHGDRDRLLLRGRLPPNSHWRRGHSDRSGRRPGAVGAAQRLGSLAAMARTRTSYRVPGRRSRRVVWVLESSQWWVAHSHAPWGRYCTA